MLVAAGFTNINIQVKENAADIIKGWMPGSGAEKYVTSAYVTATKPADKKGIPDNVRAAVSQADYSALAAVTASSEQEAPSAGC